MVPVMLVEPQTSVPINDMMRSSGLDTNSSKIPRFPRELKQIGGPADRYIGPRFVALGPYSHGQPKLQEMENMKREAAYYLCERSGRSFDEVYGKILSIVGDVRSCYVDIKVTDFSDEDLAKMMVFDGCFLLRYITENVEEVEHARMALPSGPCMLMDIFLLENQLPWLVLEALGTFNYDCVYKFVARMAKSFDITRCQNTSSLNYSYRPPHLLGLLRHHQISSMPIEEFSCHGMHRLPMPAISPIELAEIGIKLNPSKKTWFADTSIQKGLLFGKLSLTPLFLSDYTACWLVNMAAFEYYMTTSYYPYDGYTICSYLTLLAMLMDKVEDVHVLRAKHILNGTFSNQEMLDFFKGLAHHLPLGYRYMAILEKIEQYKCERTVRIMVHKFIFNNYKTIATLLSVAGVVVGFFSALTTLMQRWEQSMQL